ncbi:hypothetical protein MRB53_041130 [Persea americana]|nr:hypothetical protein MRB53_041130 [Persea americana]
MQTSICLQAMSLLQTTYRANPMAEAFISQAAVVANLDSEVALRVVISGEHAEWTCRANVLSVLHDEAQIACGMSAQPRNMAIRMRRS